MSLTVKKTEDIVYWDISSDKVKDLSSALLCVDNLRISSHDLGAERRSGRTVGTSEVRLQFMLVDLLNFSLTFIILLKLLQINGCLIGTSRLCHVTEVISPRRVYLPTDYGSSLLPTTVPETRTDPPALHKGLHADTGPPKSREKDPSRLFPVYGFQGRQTRR